MRARITAIVIALMILLPLPVTAETSKTTDQAAATQETTEEIAATTDTEAIDEYIEQLDDTLDKYLKDFSFADWWQQLLSGDISFDASMVPDLLVAMFFDEAAANTVLIGQLIVLAVICLLLSAIKDSFEKSDIALLSRAVVYLVLTGIALSTFSLVLGSSKDAITSMSDFLYAVIPILMPLLAAMGGASTVTIVNPLILTALALMVNLINNFIFPLIYLSAILRLLGHISPRFNIDKLARLFQDIGLGVMGIMTAVFMGLIGILGVATASFDGLTIKAAKSASGIFIPVVGRSLADALDSVLGTALQLKNVIGVAGVVVLLTICALPAVQILVQAIIYRLTAALIQPLGEDQLAEAINGMGSSLIAIFAVTAICCLFFFFVLAVVIGAGNISMMMR